MESKTNQAFEWSILDAFFREPNVLVRHHIDSFDYFITTQLKDILYEYNENPKSVITSDWDKEKHQYRYQYYIKFGNITLSHPSIRENNGSFKPLLPNEARLRDLVYASTIKVNISHYLIDNSSSGHQRIDFPPIIDHELTKIPILIQSQFCNLHNLPPNLRSELGECVYDEGGYFVINGNERVLILQERKSENMVHIFKLGKGNSKYSHKAEIKSYNENRPFVENNTEIKYTLRETSEGRLLYVKIQEIKQDIPLAIVFRALGFCSDQEIINAILQNDSNSEAYIELIKPSLDEAAPISTTQLAYEFIARYAPTTVRFGTDQQLRWTAIQNILRDEFLPHMGKQLHNKGFFIGYMTKRLLDVILTDKFDDRDSFVNKRVTSTGSLIASLFRGNFRKMMRDVENSVKMELSKNQLDELSSGLSRKFKNTTIFSGLRGALKTGNWNVKNISTSSSGPGSAPVGISQILSRLSFPGYLSYLRRLQTPDRTMKSVPPRRLNGTTWGFICPAETPEGANVGIVKHFALLTTITIPSKSEIVSSTFSSFQMIEFNNIHVNEIGFYTKVFINGAWVGVHPTPHQFVSELRNMRRKGVFHPHTCIHWNIEKRIVFIFTDGGRVVRPLFIIENNQYLITAECIQQLQDGKIRWHDLFNINNPTGSAVLEYLDAMESDGSMIAMSEQDLKKNNRENPTFLHYTHAEIQPTTIMGVVASTIPYSDCTQGPRLALGCAQTKQTVGIYATSFQHRMDTMAYVLYHPQRPLIMPRTAWYLNYGNLPSGMNAIVAICSYTGFNQEDAIIINQGAIDRGMYVSSFYRTYVAKEQKNQQALEDEKFTKPYRLHPNGSLQTINMNGHSYEKLEEDGFVKVGAHVEEGDAIIGKVIPLKTSGDDDIKFRDASTFVRHYENGIVDSVFVGSNDEGHKFGKVRVRTERIPQIGDKYTSKHAQKGTCGMIYKQEDMPYNRDGISPDFIVNPHGYPSRMTIGQLIECLMGKVAANLGVCLDGTPFQNYNIEQISSILQDVCGWERSGNEVLYHGKTGKQIDSMIFMGPTYYLRLKHLVIDKIHSRSIGPSVLLTRQPTEGRSRDGGLRIGEMERDVIISHGTCQFLKERMFDCSDKYFVYICKQSGMMAAVNPEEGIYKSLYSQENTTDFVKVQIPYASKLFLQELMGFGLAPRLITEQ